MASTVSASRKAVLLDTRVSAIKYDFLRSVLNTVFGKSLKCRRNIERNLRSPRWNTDPYIYRSQGWESDGTSPACIKDVDECAADHPPCSVNPPVPCRNTRGSFTCGACPHGYSGNGYYCTDIDECLINNGGCSTSPYVHCMNTMVNTYAHIYRRHVVLHII